MDELEDKVREVLVRWSGGRLGDLALELLHGDASARRYVRVRGRFAGSPLVAMLLAPETARFSEEAMGRELPDELPFANVQRYLAPTLHAEMN